MDTKNKNYKIKKIKFKDKIVIGDEKKNKKCAIFFNEVLQSQESFKLKKILHFQIKVLQNKRFFLKSEGEANANQNPCRAWRI